MIARFTVLAASALVASAAVAQDYFTPINLLPFANDRLQNRNSNYPARNPVLGGVPFRIEPSGNNIWAANSASGTNPRILEVPVNLIGVREVHTLINTDWGQPGPASSLRVEFVPDVGPVYAVDLLGNVDIRDWNPNTFTNAINGTTTTEVFLTGVSRLDKQRFTLPASFATAELRRIRIIDNGATGVQRAFVSGVTVITDPPAPRIWTTGPGNNGHRYEAVQAVNGITWGDAFTQAQQRGGYLATIASPEENAFIYAAIGGNQAFWFTNTENNGLGPWIGGLQPVNSSEPAGGWTWVINEPFSYTNWALGEPNNLNGNENRIHFLGNQIPAANTWNDLNDATLVRGFIVEYPSGCNDIDFNNDGLFPDTTDIDDFLSVFSGGPCSTDPAPGCDSIDFNNDGLFPDTLDIDSLLSVFSGGSCL
jgi:hypothetical protein